MLLIQQLRVAAAVALVAGVAGCGPNYSPDTYSTNAVQQANKVDRGIVIGVRQIDVSSPGVVGAATGAAAGGLVGSTTPGGLGSAIGTVGGGLVGGILGSSVEHATADTTAYEYIVRKPNGDLVSVTQKDAVALAIGQHVLVIAGNQARIVPDYTVIPDKPAVAPSAAMQGGPGAPPATVPPPNPATPPIAADTSAPAVTSVEPPPVPVSSAPLPAPAATAPAAPGSPPISAAPAAPAAAASPAAAPVTPGPTAAALPPPTPLQPPGPAPAPPPAAKTP